MSNSKPGSFSAANGTNGASTSYTDYKLVAPNPQSFTWKHNVMRLIPPGHIAASNDRRRQKEVVLDRWKGPVKLNRRDERKLMAADTPPAAVKPEEGGGATPSTSENTTNDQARKNRFFQKKTRRIYETPESKAAYKLKRQERNPWVLEDLYSDADGDKSESQWVGRLDGVLGDSERGTGYVLLLMENDENGDAPATFTVLPTHRSYKFTTKPKYKTLQGDEAEEEVSVSSLFFCKVDAMRASIGTTSTPGFRRSRILLLLVGKCGAPMLCPCHPLALSQTVTTA
jgi:hypothetical protein